MTLAAGPLTHINYYKRKLNGDYSIVWEMRINTDTGNKPAVAFDFASRNQYTYYLVSIFPYGFFLQHALSKGHVKNLKTLYFRDMSWRVHRREWNRYEVTVKGRHATFSGNGKDILHYEAPKKGALEGMPGFMVQQCTAQFRKIAVIQS